jgi:hypothetical protein
MRTGRIIAGGLLAGLILNVGEAALHGAVLATRTEEVYAGLNRTIPGNPVDLTSLIAVTFLQGIIGVWLYAAIRPRLGAGPRTAAAAGMVIWALSALYAAVYLQSGFSGIFPADIVWIPVAWELAEYPLAVVAGAALYRE